jgi:hypothetical protein
MMHLVERRRALTCRGTTQPADEMQDLAITDFVGGCEQFDHDFIHLA